MSRVLVLGGGVAGLTAAHELQERGFEVTVFEAAPHIGGLAASDTIEGLPTEHGFHFFPSFYRHLPDTLRRIPVSGPAAAAFPRQSVLDQLVPSSRIAFAREGDTELPFDLRVRSFQDILSLGRSLSGLGLSAAEIALFGSRLMSLVTALSSGDEEALDDVTWWNFIDADQQSKRYQRYFGEVAVRWTVAMDPRKASARTIGRIALQFWRNAMVPNPTGGTQAGTVGRVLNGPTSEAWFSHWKAHLEALGVVIESPRRVKAINHVKGKVASVAWVDRDGHEEEYDNFDYCVAALPIEPLCDILKKSPALTAADPVFRRIVNLKRSLGWMVGLQFFLNKDVPVTPGGIMLSDSPWALTATSQVQFWKEKRFRWTPPGAGGRIQVPEWVPARAERDIKGVFSVIISNWSERGDFQDRTAKSCNPDQLGSEVWAELKAHLNERPKKDSPTRAPLLKDENLVAWYVSLLLDHEGNWVNNQKLFINTVGSRKDRPYAVTEVKNFFLAGDYVRTNTDLACMEAANESARLAVNGILDDAQSSQVPCDIWPLEFELSEVGMAGARRAFEALSAGSSLIMQETAGLWQKFRPFGRR